MGTSSIFNGKNDRNPLLPGDYDPKQKEENNLVDPTKWKTVKTNMSKHIKSGGQYSSTRHIARQYVKATGGARKMASQSHAGKKVAGNIGGFFNSIINNGLENTFKNLGIEFTGKPITEVFSRLVNILAPASNTKEDIIAKEAVLEALSKVYEYIEENDMDLNSINNMPPDLMTEALKEYVGSYIWITMMNDLGSRLEIHIENAQNSCAMESEFKDMIMGIVDVEFRNKDRIIDQNVSSTLNELYERCLSVLEGIV